MTYKKLSKTIELLKDLAREIPSLDSEKPEFSFGRFKGRPKITLYSRKLEAVETLDFFREVRRTGIDSAGYYDPETLALWISAFRKAADLMEKDLAALGKSKEWKPTDLGPAIIARNPGP